MRTLNIGIVGGCMTCQTDLKLSQLFYRSLSKKLMDNDDIKCFVSLRYYNEYFRIPEQARHLIQYEKPDLIILQLRPAPFVMRSEFLIQDYQGKFIINPLIFSNRKLEKIESILGTKDPIILHEYDFQQRINKSVLLRILKSNISIGNLFRLKARVIKSVKKIITDLETTTRERQIPLFIVGNINSYNEMHNHHLSHLNSEIKAHAGQKGIPYVDLFSSFDGNLDLFFGADRFHLNSEGHERTAELLYSHIKSYLNRDGILINS